MREAKTLTGFPLATGFLTRWMRIYPFNCLLVINIYLFLAVILYLISGGTLEGFLEVLRGSERFKKPST